MRGWYPTGCVVLVLLLTAASSAAAGGDGAELRFDGAPRIEGSVGVSAVGGSVGVERIGGVQPGGGVSFSAGAVEATIVSWTQRVLPNAGGGTAVYLAPAYANESFVLTNVTLASAAPGGHALWYFHRSGGGAGGLALEAAPVAAEVPVAPEPWRLRFGPPGSAFTAHEGPARAFEFVHNPQTGVPATPVGAFQASVGGDASAVVFGFNFTLSGAEGSRDVVTGKFFEDHVEVAGRTVSYNRTFAVALLALEDVQASVNGAGYEAIFRSTAPTLHLNGSLASDSASGEVTYGGEAHHLESAPLTIEGDLSAALGVEALAPQSILPGERELQVAASLGGDFREVAIGGAVVQGAPVAGVVAVSTTAALLAALVLFWGKVKAQVGALVAPLLSRLRRTEALDHDRRREVYRAIQGRPGIHLTKIHRVTGISTSVVQHHVRVLEREGLVTSRSAGRYRVFFPTNGRDRSPRESRAIALMKDPTRRAIAQAVAEAPGRTQKDLCRALDIKQSRLSHHLLVMEEHGLVEVEPSRPKLYEPTRTLKRIL